ncbi:MAG: apolipoprotein N-acyltransferase [Thiomargarita sp.]|nr:apolipoprotein N-acyltransferase [Thiomargarita sp.]
MNLIKQLNLYDGLALLAGMLLPFAYAPYSIFPLAILSLILLFFLWQNVSVKRAIWRGLLYGIGSFGIGISWVYISFYQFGNLPLIVSLLLTMAFILVMSLYPALLGGFFSHFFPKQNAINLLLILPAIWTITEWLRGWLFTGFPWLSLGYSQIDAPLGGFAPILGIYGVSWFIALTATLLLFLWLKRQFIWQILLAITFIWGTGWLFLDISWTNKIDKPLKVALIQGNIPQEFKWLSNYQIPSMHRYLEMSQKHRDADIIIWPETAIPLLYHEVKLYFPDFIEQLVLEAQYDTDFLIGIPVMLEEKDYFNGIMSVGNQPGFYYKQYLVPFGEYIPFQNLFGSLLQLFDIPLSSFSTGEAQQLALKSAGETVGTSICYEDAFGELIRRSLPEATLLVNISNDAWFGNSIAPHQHLEIARMRALESGRYLLRATNTGISAVINPQGKIVKKIPQFKTTSLRATIYPYQGVTPYIYLGNQFIIGLLFTLITIITIKNKYYQPTLPTN